MLQNRFNSDRAPPPYLLPLACARVARPSAPAPNTYRSPRPAIRKRIRPTVRPPRATAHRTFAKGGADARTPPLFAIWRSASGTCRGGGGAFTWVANGARHSRCARGRGWRAPRAAGGLFLLGRVFCDFSIVKKYAVRCRAGRAHRGPDALANRGAWASIRVWRGRRWACNARARGRR